MSYFSGRYRPSSDPADDLDELWYCHDDDDLRERPVTLALDPAQRVALAAAVDAGLQERGCDHSLRAAEQWSAAAGVAWPGLRAQLEGNGGYCDCEVLLNVLPTEEWEPG